VNFIDVIVLVVIGLSALIAFSNGFVNVVLWILSWVGAVVATVYFFPMARPSAERYIAEPLIANVVTAVAIFIVALIVCAILNQIISRAVRGSAIGAIDRSLGLLFGLVIGAAIVCGGYMLMVWATGNEGDAFRSARRESEIGHCSEIGMRQWNGKLSAWSGRRGQPRPSNGCRRPCAAWRGDSRSTS
jgi:uncharacterized membrane protein required for colicin V production